MDAGITQTDSSAIILPLASGNGSTHDPHVAAYDARSIIVFSFFHFNG